MGLPALFWQRLTHWAQADRTVLIDPTGHRVSYTDLFARLTACQHQLSHQPPLTGQLVSLETDFSADAIAWLLALLDARAIVAPIAPPAFHQRERYFAEIPVYCRLQLDPNGNPSFTFPSGEPFHHPLTATLHQAKHPGLVLYSSGSSGSPKAVLHDAHTFIEAMLASIPDDRAPQTALAFLLWDHIGGQNTLFYNLCAGNTLCLTPDRSPATVLHAITTHRIETLVTTPSFLNWVLASEAATAHDLSSLKLVRYGTEVMLEGTLSRLRALWPNVKFSQTYGLSETGILPTRSRDDGSLWVTLGNDTTHPVRIRDGQLEVRTPTAMLGYLNQPTPWTDDGWFPTGDRVETDGEWIRILGRDSDLINIGGCKVYPAEVEQVIAQHPEVLDVLVHGEPHPLLGQLIVADVQLKPDTRRDTFERQLRQRCGQQLAEYKIPQKFNWVDAISVTTRGKKLRQHPGVSQD